MRQMPALCICGNRTRIAVRTVRKTSAAQVGHQRLTADIDRTEQAFPTDVLRPVTYCRGDGPHTYNLLPEWRRPAAGEELCRRSLSGQRGLFFRRQCGIVRLKEIMHGK